MALKILREDKIIKIQTKLYYYFVDNIITIFTLGYFIVYTFSQSEFIDYDQVSQIDKGVFAYTLVLLLVNMILTNVCYATNRSGIRITMDVFQLTVLSVGCYDNQIHEKEGNVWIERLIIKGVFSNLIFIISMFFYGIFTNGIIVESTKITILVFFNIHIFLMIGYISLYQRFQNKQKKQFIYWDIFSKGICYYTYYFSIGCMVYALNSSTNFLLYVFLPMSGATLIFCILENREKGYGNDVLYNSICNIIFFNKIIFSHVKEIKTEKTIGTKIYSDIIKLISFLIVLIRTIIQDESEIDNDNIRNSFYIIYYILFGIQLIISSIEYIYQKCCILRLNIKTEENLRKGIIQLNKENKYLQIIQINLSRYIKFKKDDTILQNKKYTMFLQFFQGLSIQMKDKKKIIKFKPDYSTFSSYFDNNYFDEIENVNFTMLKQQSINIDYNCLLNRLEKGMICNNTSCILIFKYYQGNRQDLQQIISQTLSMTLFYKKMQKYIPVNPAFILYDLFEEE